MIGRFAQIDGVAHEVVGVMPPDFTFPRQAEPIQLWLPLGRSGFQRSNWDNRGAHIVDVVGRLRMGVPLEQGRAELEAIAARRSSTCEPP